MEAYMPYLTLWDKISQNFDPTGPHFPQDFQISQNFHTI